MLLSWAIDGAILTVDEVGKCGLSGKIIVGRAGFEIIGVWNDFGLTTSILSNCISFGVADVGFITYELYGARFLSFPVNGFAILLVSIATKSPRISVEDPVR